MSGEPRHPGALVLSLDFELHWGVRDHCPPGSPYERNLLAAREVIPKILELFEDYDIAATWATVGFLFARNRQELERFRPAVLPRYRNPRLDPYLQPVGEDEETDPLHYAPSLIARIAATPRQEIATHTYCHFFCHDAISGAESFRADLRSAVAIAAERGFVLRSIVFPRNQRDPAYDPWLKEAGIVAYRGNPHTRMWSFVGTAEGASPGRRAARLADTYLPVSGDGSVGWDELVRPSGLVDVRASFILRPFHPRRALLEPLRRARLRAAVRSAARRGRILHLWWHPHNFGAHPNESLETLRALLEAVCECRTRYGMRSMTMRDVAERVLQPGLADDPGGYAAALRG